MNSSGEDWELATDTALRGSKDRFRHQKDSMACERAVHDLTQLQAGMSRNRES